VIRTSRSQRSASLVRCVTMTVVTPFCRSEPSQESTIWRASGSRALVGSSSNTRSGLSSDATARASRFRMPCEYLTTGLRPASSSPNCSRARLTWVRSFASVNREVDVAEDCPAVEFDGDVVELCERRHRTSWVWCGWLVDAEGHEFPFGFRTALSISRLPTIVPAMMHANRMRAER